MTTTPKVEMPKRVGVESKLLKGVAYHPESKTLEVEFAKSGAVYRYHDVAADTYHKLMAAESTGGHFLKHVKDAHEFSRVHD